MRWIFRKPKVEEVEKMDRFIEKLHRGGLRLCPQTSKVLPADNYPWQQQLADERFLRANAHRFGLEDLPE